MKINGNSWSPQYGAWKKIDKVKQGLLSLEHWVGQAKVFLY